MLKELSNATGLDTSNLAAKINVFALRTQVDELNINKFLNVSTGLSNLKTKLDDLDIDKLKTVPIDLKKIK